MLHITSVIKRLALGRYNSEKADKFEKSKSIKRDSKKINTLDQNDSVAVFAYGEALENLNLNYEFIDSLLVEEMTNAIENYQESKELIDSKKLSVELLPAAKEIVHDYYTELKESNSEYAEISRSIHQECDYELLKSLTHIYAKTFIKQFYQPSTNT